MKVSDEPAVNDSPAALNGLVVPDRSTKPLTDPSRALSEEERREIHAETVSLMEKARKEQEQRKRALEEKKEREEREAAERRQREQKEEEEKQERKKLERQRAEEEDLGEKGRDEKGRKGQKDVPLDAAMKSMSLDSPAPMNAVSHTHTHFCIL